MDPPRSAVRVSYREAALSRRGTSTPFLPLAEVDASGAVDSRGAHAGAISGRLTRSARASWGVRGCTGLGLRRGGRTFSGERFFQDTLEPGGRFARIPIRFQTSRTFSLKDSNSTAGTAF